MKPGIHISQIGRKAGPAVAAKRVKPGASVLVPPPRIPAHLAKELGDGWHSARVPAADIGPIVDDPRAARGPDFVISMRLFWDPMEDDQAALLETVEAYNNAGVGALILEPRQRGPGWLAVRRGSSADPTETPAWLKSHD